MHCLSQYGVVIDDHLISEQTWLDAWYWFRNAPHQRDAALKLYQAIKEADPCLLHQGAEWLADYRSRTRLVHSAMYTEGE